MRLFNYAIEEWITIAVFLSGVIYALMKFYHQFQMLNKSLKKLNKVLAQLSDHEIRLVHLEDWKENKENK